MEETRKKITHQSLTIYAAKDESVMNKVNG